MNPSEPRGFLQERFEGFEPEPERDLWPAIESELRYRSRAARIPWPYIGVAASVLVLAGTLFMLWPRSPLPSSYAGREQQAPLQEEQGSESPREEIGPALANPGESTRAAAPRLLASSASKPTQAPRKEENPLPPAQAPAQPPLHALASNPTLLPLTAPGIGDMALPALRPQPLPADRPAQRPQDAGSRNQLDMQNLSLRKVVNFAVNEVAKWEQAPIEVYREQVGDEVVQTYQLDLFKLRITRKSYQSVQP